MNGTAEMKSVLVYGGCGALGRSIVAKFAAASWSVTSVDFVENADANHNIVLEKSANVAGMAASIESRIAAGPSLNAIINVAGGWAGGNAASEGTSFSL